MRAFGKDKLGSVCFQFMVAKRLSKYEKPSKARLNTTKRNKLPSLPILGRSGLSVNLRWITLLQIFYRANNFPGERQTGWHIILTSIGAASFLPSLSVAACFKNVIILKSFNVVQQLARLKSVQYALRILLVDTGEAACADCMLRTAHYTSQSTRLSSNPPAF